MRNLIFASISSIALLGLAACDNNQAPQSGTDSATTSATPAPATDGTGTDTMTGGATTTPGTTAPAQ
ncbi:hypothetical protein [Chelativorans sp. AA-79]|uniref:hypothetical protein n=1 Tax=Chelativorans sp. AA-79 TaxID=3028735 RepID=UPI0023FA1173|nr:hypothetical protein [Chelativorans sp. AA-79]WEX07503.1 hypothetical protein PVE73_15410 [Chelativorans sp. AA-79]